MLSRRTFIAGLFVAPAIVRATSIMPVRAIEDFGLSPLPDLERLREMIETYIDRHINPVLVFNGDRVGPALMPTATETIEKMIARERKLRHALLDRPQGPWRTRL